MGLDPKAEAALALHRFGLGPRAGSIAAIAADPRGALIAELDRSGAGRIGDPDLLTSAEAGRALFHARQMRRAARLVERADPEPVVPSVPPSAAPADSGMAMPGNNRPGMQRQANAA